MRVKERNCYQRKWKDRAFKGRKTKTTGWQWQLGPYHLLRRGRRKGRRRTRKVRKRGIKRKIRRKSDFL